MGQVAGAVGVTPGTATTMVKALAESGLAEYEPYSGVRLTASGEKLAGPCFGVIVSSSCFSSRSWA
jgi:DtxR family Mn-dependent transcriptional regulator